MSAPLVSVVITNYNYAQFLPEALDSALAQTYENIEVLVVDDGSSDGSDEILRRYESRVGVIHQKNQGVAAARNRGIAEAKGSLVAFLDSDDVWLPEKLSAQIACLGDDDVGMVYTGLRYVDRDGASLGTMLTGSRGRVLEELVLLRGPGVPASGSSALIRRSTLDSVGVFDESLSTSADWDMWRRIACHYSIEVVPEPLVHYRQHEGAMHTNTSVLERDMLRAFESTFADPAAAAVHPLEHRCYGNLYLMLAGSHLQAGNVKKSLRALALALRARPGGIGYVLSTPLRQITRRLGVGLPPHAVGRNPHPPSVDS